MRRPPAPRRVLPPCVAFALAIAATIGPEVPRADLGSAGDVLARMPADSAAAMAMTVRDQLDSALAVLDASAVAARSAGDVAVEARVRRLMGQLGVNRGNGPVALRYCRESLRLAETTRDTTLRMFAMRTLATAHNVAGDYATARALAMSWMALADRTNNVEYQAWGHAMLGWLGELDGKLPEARQHLEWAVTNFQAIGLGVGERYSLTLLGNVLLSQGDYAGAKQRYQRGLELAVEAKDRLTEGRMLNNLSTVEGRTGDAGAALKLQYQALEIHKELGQWGGAVINMSNISINLMDLGRLDEAVRLGEEAMAIVVREGMDSELPWQQQTLGDAYWKSGRRAKAMELFRASLAGGAAPPVEPRVWAAASLAQCLAEVDSLDAALTVLHEASRTLAPRGDADGRGQLLITYAALLNRAGRPAEARAVAEPIAAATEAQGLRPWALAASVQLATAARLEGRREAQQRGLDRATAAWESLRRDQTDLETREMFGELAQLLAVETTLWSLAPAAGGTEAERAERAFERLQRFKTRTLLERLAGPRTMETGAPEWLQATSWAPGELRGVLREGELLLEALSGPDTTWLFAVTQGGVRVQRLPGERALDSLLSVARDVLGEPPATRRDAEHAEAVATRLGARLLDGVVDLLDRCPTLLIAPDGPLHRVPFAALGPSGRPPLVETHRIGRVPSASMLAAIRSRQAERPGRELLAFAMSLRPDGSPLAGTTREVRSLRDQFQDVRLMLVRTARDSALTPQGLAGYGALHFASHAAVDDQQPWRSGIMVRPAVPGGDPLLLTAGEIAGTRLEARLAVLSSCASGTGLVRAGEGVAGLASAFLAAGVPAVVATLWPVDDAVTARFMDAFYDGLARGEIAAVALANAQRAVRSTPSTRHPFYWAGFVLIGEGEIGLPLERRGGGVLPWAAGGGALLALGLAGIAAARGWKTASTDARVA